MTAADETPAGPPRTFAMGTHEALFPSDRVYAEKTHLWLAPSADGRYRVGLTAYSVRLLNDVYFLDWSVDGGTDVRDRQDVGEIESSKAVSSLHVPAAGRIVSFNESVLADPSAINTDTYGEGWLYEFETDAEFVGVDEYVDALTAAWDRDQRYLKKQANA